MGGERKNLEHIGGVSNTIGNCFVTKQTSLVKSSSPVDKRDVNKGRKKEHKGDV